ncbi:hypothetical protein FRX31_018280 [Thalictrum thalictroides]|uniref:Uncharacterized protein n=1 Tax=Thalictrum thalictroides TaxID=46969 RepID=A0A7J6W439_THATH|nr:hypothetical protein FRX31_018280 [Thalictrum thalictroides]
MRVIEVSIAIFTSASSPLSSTLIFIYIIHFPTFVLYTISKKLKTLELWVGLEFEKKKRLFRVLGVH